MAKLGIEAEQNISAFSVTTVDGQKIRFNFPNAPKTEMLAVKSDGLTFFCEDKTRAVVYTEGDKVLLIISREDLFPKPISLQIIANSISNNSDKHLKITDPANLNVQVFDGSISNINDNVYSILMTGSQMRIEISQSSQSSAVFAALDLTPNVTIYPGQRLPEFEIQVYDDSEYTRLRPTKLSIPVASTVPAYGSEETHEIQWFEDGKGPAARTIYFKAITTFSDIDSLVDVYLILQVPTGLDTVSEPIFIEMTKNDDDEFLASYEFHREDTVNYVDGFAYMSVYVPLTVETYLPLGLDISGDGELGGTEEAEETEFSEFSAASIDTENFKENSPQNGKNKKKANKSE